MKREAVHSRSRSHSRELVVLEWPPGKPGKPGKLAPHRLPLALDPERHPPKLRQSRSKQS